MTTGVFKFPNKTVYYGEDGIMRYGEQKIGGEWYCFQAGNGKMITGFHRLPGKQFIMRPQGKCYLGSK